MPKAEGEDPIVIILCGRAVCILQPCLPFSCDTFERVASCDLTSSASCLSRAPRGADSPKHVS